MAWCTCRSLFIVVVERLACWPAQPQEDSTNGEEFLEIFIFIRIKLGRHGDVATPFPKIDIQVCQVHVAK